MTPSAAIPPTTPTKFAAVSSTIPLTFGVTATGRFQSFSHRRIRVAFAGSMPSPITTSGRLAFASRPDELAALSRVHLPGAPASRPPSRSAAPRLGAAAAGFSASRADSVR